ncbi:hypothetical protein AC249_AIPGENE18829 [Exaiptasia diaphana]|nr:hypothetical protein AC249_AIPGENE18829 [Exaiptasia diaphana]
MAYQGVQSGVTNGSVRFNDSWTTGTECKQVRLSQTWMAMTEVPQTWNYHDFIRVDFPNTPVPSEADNDAFCQETTRTQFKTCVKDLVGLKNKHHPIEVDYMVFGDLDPCINKTCEYFGVCQAMSASVAQCVCVTQCPSYQDLDWMAFETLHLPLFSDHGSVHFGNTQTPLKSNNYAFCEVRCSYRADFV